MLQIVKAYDRSPIAEVATDGVDGLEAKLDLAACAFRDGDRFSLDGLRRRKSTCTFDKPIRP
jgi:hypothetical protein